MADAPTPSRDELIARYEKLQQDSKDLLRRYQEAAQPPAGIRRRKQLLALAVLVGGCVAGGMWLGVLGVVLAPVALVLVLVAAFLLAPLGKRVIAGAPQPLGDLHVELDPGTRTVELRSTFTEPALAALAYAERTLHYWSLGDWRLAAPGQQLRAALAELAAGGTPELGAGWTVREAPQLDRFVLGAARDRFGVSIRSMGMTIGGSKPEPVDVNAGCIAVVRDAVLREPRLRDALLAQCDSWTRPPFVAGRGLRVAAHALG